MLSIGVIAAILFECAAKLIRSYLTDIAGKKADLIISSALLRRVMAVKCRQAVILRFIRKQFAGI